jgi:hypothetical protein
MSRSRTATENGASTEVELDPAVTQGSTQVATQPPQTRTAVAVREETGFEDFTQEDLKVPFLVLLQGKSPQAEEGNPKQLPGAKAGMLMNNVTNELYSGKDGIRLIPVHRVHSYLEWIPRDDGGGLVSVYDWRDPIVAEARKKAGKKFGKFKVNDNNDLVQTFNVYCLLIKADGKTQPVVLGFSSTQIGAYQAWMTIAMSQTKQLPDGTEAPRPLWSHKYKLTTVFNSNKKGTWFKMHIGFDGETAEDARLGEDEPLSKAAKEFRELVTSGAAQADFSSAQQEHDAGEADAGFAM